MATWPLSLLLPQLVQSGSTIMKLNCLLKLGDNILSQPSFSNLVPKLHHVGLPFPFTHDFVTQPFSDLVEQKKANMRHPSAACTYSNSVVP